MAKNALDLNDQARKVLEIAGQKGVQTNFFFVTTFKRYQVQMKILANLEKAIEEYGMTVTKEYVKGRQNLVSNPAITEYNKTAQAANNTVQTLIKIIQSFAKDEGGTASTTLEEFMRRLEDE